MAVIQRIYSLSDSNSPHSCVCNYCTELVSGHPHEIPHTDDHIKIIRVKSGGMDWIINNTRHTLADGAIMIMNNTELRMIESVRDAEPLLLDWVQFTPMTVYPNVSLSAHFKNVEFAKVCSIFYHRPPGFSNVIDMDSPYYKNIAFYYDRLATNAMEVDILQDEAVVSNLRALVIEITRYYASVLPADVFLDDFSTEHEIDVLTQAIEYVREHYAQNISEMQLAQKLFVSTSNLSRIFNHCLGISFRTYLRQLRLEKTLTLLDQEPSMTVLDAAMACGFNSASGFYKALGAICGKGGIRLLKKQKEPL